MHMDDGEETDVSRPIFKASRDIIDGDRGSAMKHGSIEKVARTRAQEATSNELTFQVEFWKTLMRNSRLVQLWQMQSLEAAKPQEHWCGLAQEQSELGGEAAGLQNKEVSQNSTKPEDWTERAWDKDHLRGNWCADFHRIAVPMLQWEDDDVLTKLMKSFPRVQTPRPDLAYGLRNTAFTEEQQKVNDLYRDWAETSNNLYHGFFLIECKTDGTIEAAENQACRGGATLVNARMEFIAKCAASNPVLSLSACEVHYMADNGEANPSPALLATSVHQAVPQTSEESPLSKADLDSFAFSLVLVPAMASLYVHWAELRDDDRPIFHMSFMEQYRLLKGRDLEKLRHDINNILDWGTLKRKTEILKFMAPIETQMKAANKRQRV